MNKPRFRLALSMFAGALLACAAPFASAVIIQVNAPGLLAPGPFTLHDFEAGPGGAGATYTSTSGVVTGTAASLSGNVTPSGLQGITTSQFPDPITITFAQAASSVGMFFGNDDTCCSGVFTANLDIFGTAGLLGTISVVANMNDFADQFIGFNSDELVTSVALRYGSGSDVGLFTYIDDVQFNVAAAVPAPGVLALLGLGLAVLAPMRRRARA